MIDRKILLSFESESKNDVIIHSNKHHTLTTNSFKNNGKEMENILRYGTYTNSKPTVDSYASIFETLWNHIDLYEQVKVLYYSLLQRDEALGEFVQLTAHEIRNPLQSILGPSNILSSKKDITSSYGEMINIISGSVKNLQKLTKDMLDAAKFENQSLKISKKRINLTETIKTLINNFSIRNDNNPNNNSKVQIDFKTIQQKNSDYFSLFVKADKDRIAQVIFNPLNNAVKFSHKNSKIKVTLSLQKKDKKNYALIKIKDSGNGIDSSILPIIFTKFVSTSKDGTGLGLYLCKSIVEDHGGRIWAENNKDNNGATFAFTLPLR
jgi:two-component system sensor histidine kinase VicK